MCKIEISHAYFDNLIIANSTSTLAWSRSNKNGLLRIVIEENVAGSSISRRFQNFLSLANKLLENFFRILLLPHVRQHRCKH